jgi:signal transduction histidine kinase
MTKPIEHTGMVRYLSGKLVPLSTGIALLIAVLAPVTFWTLAHRNLQHMVSLYAEDLADHLREVALESPALWKYQTYKFIAIADRFHPTIDVSGFRVLDEKGEPISGRDYQKVDWGKPGRSLPVVEELKVTLGVAPVMFNNVRVGTVEVLADDTRLLRTNAIIFGFSLLVGTVLAVLVYRFPVRVVRGMEREIGALIVSLRRSEENYRSLNEELELKVEERTGQLLEAQEELVRREKLATLGQLSGSVGHELRNPLGVMSNAIYFLRMVHSGADETTKEYLDIIKHEIDNSQRIITDLLDFARTRPPRTKVVTVPELLAESLGRCTVPGNVDLRTEIPDVLPGVRVDPLQMGQVLQNLIANAVQAMPNGGSLRISARKERGTADEGRIPRASDPGPDDDFVEISVADTGEGIASDNMKKLFQPLFTTKAKGIGLGLVVSRNLVETNGGRIDVTSRYGEGTTFTVILPAEG